MRGCVWVICKHAALYERHEHAYVLVTVGSPGSSVYKGLMVFFSDFKTYLFPTISSSLPYDKMDSYFSI
jgi:hypothetical protein